jgi:hypothetical protein
MRRQQIEPRLGEHFLLRQPGWSVRQRRREGVRTGFDIQRRGIDSAAERGSGGKRAAANRRHELRGLRMEHQRNREGLLQSDRRRAGDRRSSRGGQRHLLEAGEITGRRA